VCAFDTYIHSSHNRHKNWSECSSLGMLASVSRREQLIILHVGGHTGFISYAQLIFKSNQKTGDFHSETDSDNYIHWLREKLIPSLDLNSVLLVDNVSCQNTQKDKGPTSNPNKETAQNWLCGRSIHLYNSVLKVQLYEIMRAYIPKYKSFIVDEIMAVNSHMVLRILPCHADLKPVALIWADVKQWLRVDNTTFHINDIKHICEQGFKETWANEWFSVCEHVDKIEKQYYDEEGVMENMIETIIITDSGMSSSSSFVDSECNECQGEISGIKNWRTIGVVRESIIV
jgi:hypothetical protein